MEPAERSDRLKAALVDGLILAVLWLVGWLPFLGWAAWVAGLAVVGYQWYLLATKGQTIGKRMFDMRIVTIKTIENGGFVPNVLLRSVVNGLLTLIPFYLLVDSLFIFRDDRRCVHDWIAGTRVIKAYG